MFWFIGGLIYIYIYIDWLIDIVHHLFIPYANKYGLVVGWLEYALLKRQKKGLEEMLCFVG